MTITTYSESQLVDIRQQFNMMDLDRNGFITKPEFRKSIIDANRNPEEYDLDDFFAKADKNKDGKISFHEFVEACSSLGLGPVDQRRGRSDKEVDVIFRRFDQNGDGYISQDELKSALKSLGEQMTDEQVLEMFREADKNRDNKISREEFAMMITA
ncbi:hypothetical protein BGZ58_008631 [Dissophora ornata]|nr:hypothetical protein BGZ58_008631 [Dissophora ornata]